MIKLDDTFFRSKIMEKRLYRSRTNRMLAGVCGGLGKYFNVDPTLIRVLAVILLIFFNFATLIAYIILAIIVPLEPLDTQKPVV
jgi:phage shock protein PspC (stress-responsive transcriptional regulator)